MTRTLVLITVIGFVLAVACFASALAIVGGPFSIDDGWRFHRETWGGEAVERRAYPSPPAGEGRR